jgi:hypothetical protein
MLKFITDRNRLVSFPRIRLISYNTLETRGFLELGLKLPSAVLLIVLAGLTQQASAQGPPIRGEGGGVQFFQGNVFRSWSEWTSSEVRSQQGLVRSLNYVQPLVFSYVAFPGLALRMRLPLASKHFDPGEVSTLPDSITGLGDLAVSGKYRFYFRPGHGTRIDLAAISGVKLPTGDSNRNDLAGERLPRPMQLGTGSVDAFWKLAASYADGPKGYSLFANLSQTLASESAGYEFGNRWEAVGGVRKRFFPVSFKKAGASEIYGELALLYLDRAQDLNDGKSVTNSGRRTLAVAPGLTFIFAGAYLLEISTRIPVFHSFQGNQMEEVWNLGFGFRVVY